MQCVICKHGETQPGYTTVTLERGGTLLVFKGVPAQVCTNCGEAYVSEAVTEHLLQEAEEAARTQVRVGVRELAPVSV